MFMRHAKAGWPDAGVDDHERVLNKRGRAAAAEMAERLLQKYKAPDCILSSTAKRAVETANLFAEEIGYDGSIELRRRLYLAETDVILDVVSELDASFKRVLVIGHNPGFSELASVLSDSSIQMTTAAIFIAESKISKFSSFDASTIKRSKLIQPHKDDQEVTMTPPQLPSKPDVCLALLQSSNSIYVHLDPRREEAHVPPWFKEQAQLVLQVGLNMAVPIPDLDVGPEALSCTLSFNRRAEFCHIDWNCIYGIVGEDGRGMIWPESVPPEVAAAAEGRPQQAPTSQRPSLRLATEDGKSLKEEPKLETNPISMSDGLKERIGLAASLDDEMSQEELQLPERVDTETIKKVAKKTTPQITDSNSDGETSSTKSGRSIPSYLRVVK